MDVAVHDRPATVPEVVHSQQRQKPSGSGALKPALPLIAVVCALALWQVMSYSAEAKIIPGVPAIAGAFWAELTGPMWSDLWATVGVWASGLLGAAIVAIPVGLLIGLSRFWTESTRFIIEFLRPIPPIAILPLAVLVLGTGPRMIVSLATFASIWPLLYQSIGGVRDRDPVLTDTFRVYGMSKWQYLLLGVFPQSLPFVITGLKISATIALVVTVATEIVAGGQGIGFRIAQMSTAELYPEMYALIVVAGLLGLVVTYLLRVASKQLLSWHASERADSN
jgi:ABC-type nitrate/sulfonate/bicarbonate transport system permease component